MFHMLRVSSMASVCVLWTSANRRKGSAWFCKTLYLKQQKSLSQVWDTNIPRQYKTWQSRPFTSSDRKITDTLGVKRAGCQDTLLSGHVSRAACSWLHFETRRSRQVGRAACMNCLLALQSMAVSRWFGSGFGNSLSQLSSQLTLT